MVAETLRVLVVEDSGVDYLLIERALGRMPGSTCVVDRAVDLPRAIEALTTRSFDVCLCDYRLGADTGVDLIRRARGCGVDIPLMLLTGFDRREIDLQAMEAGASHFMTKDDVDARRLERAIRYCLGQHATQQRLSRMAWEDALTGLSNRAAYEHRLAQLCDAEGCLLQDVAMLYLDLDGFKAINDTFGHAVGDEVLAETGARVRSVLEPVDFAARLGGDEFVVLTTRSSVRQTGRLLQVNLQHRLAAPYALASSHTLQCSVSIGVAIGVVGEETAGALFERADRAMYETKRGISQEGLLARTA